MLFMSFHFSVLSRSLAASRAEEGKPGAEQDSTQIFDFRPGPRKIDIKILSSKLLSEKFKKHQNQ